MQAKSAAIWDQRNDDSDSGSDSADTLDPNDEGYEDIEPDEEAVEVKGLFSDEVFSDVGSMLEDCKARFNFDLIGTQKHLGV
jgi:type I protein arginine methyltransferase